ncbi:hypothetical protein OPT61_g10390 [Boeremia exigua]|uniref:Uncharacterized protein n=1 Tax=Boeremia exigua TaxID=749465 RepID=A0ACC2HQQ1_9PLEO|nr:hypothetical protein OPT61_g10390 [Boeremia exigua]
MRAASPPWAEKLCEWSQLRLSNRNFGKAANNTMPAKRTPVPVPGSKPKSKSKVVPPKTSLSQELVGSDDDSSTDSAPKAKKTEKPKATIGVHKPSSAAKSSAKDKSTPKVTPIPKPTPKKPAPKTIATPKQVEELSSSEVSDDDDAPARDIPTKLPGEVEMKDASSESDSDSESESDSSSEEAAEPAPKPTKPAASKPQQVELRAAKPYAPPKGFVLVSEKDRTTSKAAKIFDNLQGKQVWHITAPAGVSLKELESISMDKAMKGDSILSQKGTDYGFSKTEKSEDGPREVLVPQKNGYSAVPAKISQTLHLQELVRLPKLSSKQADPNTGSEAAASITRSTIRAPRPQVKGLKMRYLPLGFVGADSGGVLGDTDSEGDDVPQERAGLAVPKGLNLPTKAGKRKHTEANGEEAPSKKIKKHRSPEELKKREEKKAKKDKKAKA